MQHCAALRQVLAEDRITGQVRARWAMLFPASVLLLLGLEQLLELLRVFTLSAEATDFHAQVLQLCLLLGLLLRALFALLDRPLVLIALFDFAPIM